MRILAMALFLAGASSTGCHVAATAEEYSWSIRAPSAVGLHGRLFFSVEARAGDGLPVVDVPFVWVVDWVGVDGVEHQGRSAREHHLLVKGGPGTATLRVLAIGPHGRPIEVARHSFRVEWGGPVSP